MFGAVIMRIVYGLDVAYENDKYLDTAEEAIAAFNLAFMPGRYLVERFPSMRFLPKWFPGANFKREAAEWRPAILSMRNQPWDDGMKAIVSIRSLVAVSMADSLFVARGQCRVFDAYGPQGSRGGRRG